MKRSAFSKHFNILYLCLSASLLHATAYARSGWHLIPRSSVEKNEDVGVRSHTNHVLLFTDEAGSMAPQGLSPAQIRQVYALPNTMGSAAIAVIDAYDYPTAVADFNVFSTQFGLPIEPSANPTGAHNHTLEVVYSGGHRPPGNAGWNEEAALDIEWAHAMAPGAKIYLVEARSCSYGDLMAAVNTANHIPGVKEISMSWGGTEFRGEEAGDAYFQKPGVVYFASSGDTGGRVIYPGASAHVVSCGGTTLNFDDNGLFLSEVGWNGSGGGHSRFEFRPGYQNAVQAIVGTSRGVPDISFDGDPESGVAVYDSTPCDGMSGWMIFGGTSVSAPALAGIINSAATARGSFAPRTCTELGWIYTNRASAFFRDITEGSAGAFLCGQGWDFVTGVGSVQGYAGK